MSKKSIKINALLNGLRSALNLIFPLITFPYVSRILSVDSMGIYNFSNTYINYFVLLAGLGVSTYAVREGAKYRDNRDKISSFASEVFTINIVSTILAYIILFCSLVIFNNLYKYITCILVFSLQLLFNTIGTEWVYNIYEDYSYITIRSIAFKIISIILLFIFVKNATDYLWYAGITVFASVGSNALNYINAKKILDIRLTKRVNWKYHLKPILVIFASSVAITLYVSSDTTILGLLKGDYAVGIYGVAVKIYTIASSLISGLLIVTIPRLAMLLGKRRIQEYKIVLGKVISSVSILVLPAAIGLIMLSKEVVLIIAGEKYLNSIFSLQIITSAFIFSNYGMVFNECILIPAKRENSSLYNTLITGIVNVVLNFVLIPLWSYDGAALSTVIAEFMVMILNGWSARDYIKPIFNSKKSIKNIIDALVGCTGIVVVCFILKIGVSSLTIRTLLSVVLSVGIYAAILVLMNNDIAMEYIEKIYSRIKRI